MVDSRHTSSLNLIDWIKAHLPIRLPFRDRHYLLALAGIALFFSLHIVYAGTIRQDVYCHDAPLLYDGGWRIYCGFKPYVDFYSSLGPVIYAYIALGYCLFGPNTDSLAYMNAIALPAFMALGWHSLRSRMPSFWLFWFILLSSFCLVSEHGIRDPFWRDTYAGCYNRHGYAWLMLFAALLYSPKGTASQFQLRANAFFAGCILSILLFLKISYFISALPLLLIRPLLSGQRFLSYAWIAGGFCAVSFLVSAYLNFHVASMISDLQVTARARAHDVTLWRMGEELLLMKWQFTVVLIIVILTWKQSPSHPARSILDNILIPAAFLTTSVMVFESNGPILLAPSDELPLIPVLLIVLLARDAIPLEAVQTPAAISISRNGLLAIFLCLLSSSYYLVPDAVSILWSVYSPHRHKAVAFDSDSMHKLLFDELGFGALYTTKTNDGLELLRANHLNRLRITTLDYTSPFSFALLSPPPIGAPTYWASGSDIAQTSFPDQNKAFRGVDVVMVPKEPDDADASSLLQNVYGGYLKNNFDICAESQYWTAFKRK